MFSSKPMRLTLLSILTAALFATSCNVGATPAPTADVNALSTALVGATVAQLSVQLTQTAQAVPTNNATPTVNVNALPTFALPTENTAATSDVSALPTFSFLNDLLDLTQLESGQSGLNLGRVTPAELVQNIAEEGQRRILEYDLNLTCFVQPQLPEVLVDRHRISHVFQNFINNAIKHSPPFGEMQVRVVETGGGVQFSIIDHGPGVPEEYQGRIFDRFFRVPGQARTGAGLGLSISREIAVAHGGRIGVYSEPGKGSEFYVVLPCADEDCRSSSGTASGLPLLETTPRPGAA